MATVFLTIVSAVVTFYLDSIAGAWKMLLVTGAGTGSVLLLRWYWWRINAWSEVSAMIAAFITSITLQVGLHMDSDDPRSFAWIMIITVGITTVVWLAVTFLTPAEPREVLVAFYRRTRPSLAGWRPIAALAPEVKPVSDLGANAVDWVAGLVLIYGVLFGTGKLLLHETGLGVGTAGVRTRGRRRDLFRFVAERVECGYSVACCCWRRWRQPVLWSLRRRNWIRRWPQRKLKWKNQVELSLDAPDTFRIEPYSMGGAHITGGDLRGLMYGLLEAAEQIRATGTLYEDHRQPGGFAARGAHRDERRSWKQAPEEFWNSYFRMLARNRFNRVHVVFRAHRSAVPFPQFLSHAAADYGIDFTLGVAGRYQRGRTGARADCLSVDSRRGAGRCGRRRRRCFRRCGWRGGASRWIWTARRPSRRVLQEALASGMPVLRPAAAWPPSFEVVPPIDAADAEAHPFFTK